LPSEFSDKIRLFLIPEVSCTKKISGRGQRDRTRKRVFPLPGNPLGVARRAGLHAG